jgi:hypothetical protein
VYGRLMAAGAGGGSSLPRVYTASAVVEHDVIDDINILQVGRCGRGRGVPAWDACSISPTDLHCGAPRGAVRTRGSERGGRGLWRVAQTPLVATGVRPWQKSVDGRLAC